MSLQQKRIKITIDQEGNYELEAMEGFSGTSCVEETQCIEVALGGVAIDEGKKAEYYESDDDAPVFVDID